jgi:hypothetical protein
MAIRTKVIKKIYKNEKARFVFRIFLKLRYNLFMQLCLCDITGGLSIINYNT